MATIHKYQIKCTTDDTWETIWAENEPTTCPTNTSHSINSGLTSIIDSRDSNTVEIKEETIPTGGNFKFKSFTLDNIANSTTTTNISFTHPVNVVSVQITTEEIHRNDVMCWMVSPNTIVGAITSDVSIGDTTINVSETVSDNVKVGYHVNLWTGLATEDLGIVIAVDTIGRTITVDTPSTAVYTAATPTYFRMTIMYADHIELGPPQTFELGASKIGASFLPANVPLVCEYENKHISEHKKLYVYLQYLY